MTDPGTRRFLELLGGPPAPPTTLPSNGLPAATSHDGAYVRVVCANLAATAEGSRNVALNLAACTLGRRVRAGLLTEGEATAALTDAALRAGLQPGEIRGTIHSGLTHGMNDPTPLDPNGGLPQLTVLGGPVTPSIRRSWQRVDLDAVLTGTHTAPTPTVGTRSDGAGLFYPGRLHTVASESEGGKTWLALAAARHELDSGNSVIYVDFEDDEGGIAGRLLALGADPRTVRDRFAYIRPEESVNLLGNREDLLAVLTDLSPTLAVLDGVTEAMVLHGLEMKDNTDVAAFGQILPRWIADRGPACVALDHVVKDRENRGRYAIGGVHKLNGVNGAAYLLDNRAPFSIGREGRSTVYVAKDRPGQVRRHCLPASERRHWFADLTMTSHDERNVEIGLSPPDPLSTGDNFRPTAVMTRIAAVLADRGPLAQRTIEALVTGKSATIRQALILLQVDGHVSVESPHGLIKPYP